MIVVLDNLRSALNVGSIVRTCDGLGIRDLYICGITPELNNNKVLKTSLGAEKKLKSKYFNTTQDAILYLKENSYKIIGLEITEDSIPINLINKEKKIALVVGNEVSGVSEDILKECDLITHIPMKGNKKSFNVSVAFSIAAYSLTLD